MGEIGRSRVRTWTGGAALAAMVAFSAPALPQNATIIDIDPNGAGNTAITNTEVQGQVEDTPILNIATPNAGGLSHNMFTRYDVGPEGLVINNHGGDTPLASDLAGAVFKNPNLSINNEARIILNEITSTSRSNLYGPHELVGRPAEFILANPNGVTCNGCGFLKFPRASIITGSPNFGADGSLTTFDVDGGDVAIEGTGADATSTDFFDIVSRSIAINGQINARNLNITSGRNLYDYGTRIATPKADDPNGKPEFGIDSSALGGMYTDRITLVGTESGVGVRLRGDAAANAGDMTITADGKLVFKSAAGRKLSATGNFSATSHLDRIEFDGADLTSGGNLEVSASSLWLLNGASVKAGEDASHLLSVDVTGDVSVANSLLKSNGSLAIDASTISVDALSTGADKGIQSLADATLAATDTVANEGFIAAGSTLTIEAWNLIHNRSGGKLQGGTELALDGGPTASGKFTNEQDAMALAPVVSADRLSEIRNKGTIIANSTTEKSVLVADSVTNEGDGDVATASLDGLIYANAGIEILTALSFDNIDDAFLFTDLGDILLGGADAASAQGTVRNADSAIESRTGDVRIYADLFENTGTAAATSLSAPVAVAETGWSNFLILGSELVSIVSTCGSFGESDFGSHVGQTCGRSASRQTETIDGSASYRSRVIAGNDIDIYVKTSALNKISILSAANDLNLDGDAGAVFTNESQPVFTITSLDSFNRDSASGVPPILNVATTPTFGVTYQEGTNAGFFGCTPANACFAYIINGVVPPGADKFVKAYTDIGQATHKTPALGVLSTVEAGNTLTASLAIQNVNLGADDNFGSTSLAAATGPIVPSVVSLAPSSPLFVQNQDPTAQFLFQTNPLFSVNSLLGSAAFLAQIGYDPNQYQFLGDAYYEQQYLRQQILNATGQRFIADGLTSEDEQYKLLLESGEAVREDLDIAFGVALTPEQVASLQQDVVLLVEVEVGGKKVLAPKLYLAASTDRTIVGGALFAANDIDIKTDGGVLNEGTMIASNDLSIDAGETATNRRGKIEAGNRLDITADGDVTNLGGSLKGTDVLLESREGSVTNITEKRDIADETGKTAATVVGDTATIEGSNSLTIRAKESIVSLGGQVTGEDVELSANDVTFEGIETTSRSTETLNERDGLTSSSSTRTTVTQTEVQGAKLNVTGDLTVNAGDEFRITGSDVDVAGDTTLNVNRLTIESQQETTQIEQQSSSFRLSEEDPDNGAILLFKREETDLRGTVVSQRQSTVELGGNLTIRKGQDEDGNTTGQSENVTISGSQLKVSGDTVIDAQNVDITAAKETVNLTQTTNTTANVLGGKTQSGAPEEDDPEGEQSASARGAVEIFRSQSATETLHQETAVSSVADFGGSLTINSKPGQQGEESSVNITGSEISVGDKLKIDAENIDIEAAETKSTYSNVQSNTSGSLAASVSTRQLSVEGSVDVTTATTTLDTTDKTVSQIKAGSVELNASNKIRDEGTQYDTSGDIEMTAEKGVEIEAATSTENLTVEGNATKVTIAARVSFDKIGDAIDAVQDKVLAEEKKRAVEANPDAVSDYEGVDENPDLSGLNAENIDEVVPDASISLTVGHEETTDTVTRETAQTSTLASSGGQVKITSGETGSGIKIEGATLDAGEGVTITAKGGDVDISVAETTETRTTTTAGGSGTLSYDPVNRSLTVAGEGHTSGPAEGDGEPGVSITRQQTANITSGGDVTIRAEQGHTTLTGTRLDAGTGIEITGESVTLDAARDTLTVVERSQSGSGSLTAGTNALSVEGSGASNYTRQDLSLAEATSLKTASGDITVTAGGDADDPDRSGNPAAVTSEGTSFSAERGTVEITGDSVTLDVTRDTYDSTTDNFSLKVGLSGTKSGSNQTQVQEDVDGSGTAGTGGGVDVSLTIEQETENASRAVAGTIDAQNLTIKATDGDATVVGGDMNIAGDTKIDATGGKVALQAAENTYDKSAVNVEIDVSLSLDKAKEVTKQTGSGSNNGSSSGQTTGSSQNTPGSTGAQSSTQTTQGGGLGDNASPLNTSQAGNTVTSSTNGDKGKKATPGIVESLLVAGDISVTVDVEETHISEKEGGTLNSGGRVDIAGEDIEIEGTQIAANGGSLDAKGGDVDISSAKSTVTSNQTEVEIGLAGEFRRQTRTKTGTRDTGGSSTTDTGGNTNASGDSSTSPTPPPRPSTPAPGGTDSTSASTSSNPPPRPSTPAPGGTDSTSASTSSAPPPRPSTPAPSTPPENSSSGSGSSTTAAQNEDTRSGESKSGSLEISVATTDIDSTTHRNAKIDFGTGPATIDADDVTIKGGEVTGSEVSGEVAGDLTVKSVADSVEVNATEFTLEVAGSSGTFLNTPGKKPTPTPNPTDTSTSGDASHAPPRPSTPAPGGTDSTSASNSPPPRPSTPAPGTTSTSSTSSSSTPPPRPSTPAPGGTDATSASNSPPPRPSTPAPGGTDSTSASNSPPPRPSTPAPGGTDSTSASNSPPPRPSTPAPSTPPGNATSSSGNSSTEDDEAESGTGNRTGSKRVVDVAGMLQTGVDIDIAHAEKKDTTVSEVSGITATNSLTLNVQGTTTVDGATINAGEGGELNLTTQNLVVGDDLEGSKSQSVFNFRFAASINPEKIAENWDTTEDNAFDQQGFLKAGAQADSSSSSQTVRSTIGEGTVTVTGEGNDALANVNRDVDRTVETSGSYDELELRDTNVLKGDIAQEALDDVNSRIDKAIERGEELKAEKEEDIAKVMADPVAGAEQLSLAAKDIVATAAPESAGGTAATGATGASAPSIDFAAYLGPQVTMEKSEAANQSLAMKRMAAFTVEFRKLQDLKPGSLTPADLEAAFSSAGVSVDLSNAADPQALYEQTLQSLARDARNDLSGILGQDVTQSQLEAMLANVGGN